MRSLSAAVPNSQGSRGPAHGWHPSVRRDVAVVSVMQPPRPGGRTALGWLLGLHLPLAGLGRRVACCDVAQPRWLCLQQRNKRTNVTERSHFRKPSVFMEDWKSIHCWDNNRKSLSIECRECATRGRGACSSSDRASPRLDVDAQPLARGHTALWQVLFGNLSGSCAQLTS